jgi:hypothetical protein
MLHRFPLHRAARGLASALCAALLACSGAGDGPTAPDGPPDDGPTAPVPVPVPDPIPAPFPVPPDTDPPGDEVPGPGPTQPGDNITGAYALIRINNAEPGQVVTLANPDGSVIGLYRFHENTFLGLTEQQTWTLSIHFADERGEHHTEDRGSFTRHGDGGIELAFESETFGDAFHGAAGDGFALIQYDMDGDGAADTFLVFARILGPGD